MRAFIWTMLSVSSVWSADAFVNSCLDKMKSEALALKSLRADMVQTIEVAGHTTEQKAKVQYLIADRFYSKTEMETPMGAMTMLCRGDTTYMKIGTGAWSPQKSTCAENPLTATYDKLKGLTLQFQKELNGARWYQDQTGATEYVFETSSCRLIRMNTTQNGSTGFSTLQYQKFGAVDLPVRIETTVPGQATSVMEFKAVAVNAGITKAFFQVK